jgi:hypothetical protein
MVFPGWMCHKTKLVVMMIDVDSIWQLINKGQHSTNNNQNHNVVKQQ